MGINIRFLVLLAMRPRSRPMGGDKHHASRGDASTSSA
jgi:hypothetical protein